MRTEAKFIVKAFFIVISKRYATVAYRIGNRKSTHVEGRIEAQEPSAARSVGNPYG
jgi:hypothetical protein